MVHRAETDRCGGQCSDRVPRVEANPDNELPRRAQNGCHCPISFSQARSGKPKLKSKAKSNRSVQA